MPHNLEIAQVSNRVGKEPVNAPEVALELEPPVVDAPARVDETRFVTDSSPHTSRNMLRSWPLAEQIEFFERELGLPLVEEEATAKLFPVSNRARDVRDGLLALAARRGARFLPETRVTGLVPAGQGGGSSARAARRSRPTR